MLKAQKSKTMTKVTIMNDTSPKYTTLWEVEEGQFFTCDGLIEGELFARIWTEPNNKDTRAMICIDRPNATWKYWIARGMSSYPVTLVEEVVISYKV